MKNYYLPHEYYALQDDKIVNLIQDMGMEGYGIFWGIIERLYQENGRLEKEYDRIAFVLHSNCEKIKHVVEDFNLFKSDEKFFWSESADKRVKEIKRKSVNARKSVMSRWNRHKRDDTNVLRTLYDSNTSKEKKIKENNILSKDNTETKVSGYGKPEINEIIEETKRAFNLPVLDGSVASNRKYAQLLFVKSKNNMEGIRGLIAIAATDEWYKNNITSVKDLYYNAAKIVARRRGQNDSSRVADFTKQS